MIWCKLKKWQSIEGLQHSSTSWKVCSDKAGNQILKQWDKSNMLEFLFWDVELPPDVTYYVFAKRHFSTNVLDVWSDPIPVMNQSVEYSNILHKEDTEIEIPTIFINKEDIIKEGASNFPFRVSKFRSNNDQHKYTSYLILDQSDNILFSRMLEQKNLTEIQVPCDYKFTIAKQLKFIAIQGGVSGLESPIARKFIEMGVDHNFEILTNISNVLAKQELIVKFGKIKQEGELGILQVELLEYSQDSVLESLKLNDQNEIKIPWYLLQENSRYRLRITIKDDMVDFRYVYRTIQVENYTNSILRSLGTEMNNKLEKSTMNNFIIPNGFHSEALFNKKIILPKNGGGCAVYSIGDKDNIITNSPKDINLGLDNNNDLWIRPLNKERILIDGIKNGKATFLIYSYNTYTEEYTLVKSIKRDDETIALGKTNNILQISPDEFIYNPVGTNKLKKLNINTDAITNLAEIPLEGITKAVLIRVDNNRMYIVNGTTYHSCMYNIADNTFGLGYSYGPNEYINKDTKSIPLINGSTLLVKLTHENTDDDKSSIQYFNWKASRLENTKLGFKGNTIGSTLLLYSGVVLLTKVNGNNTDIYKYS